MKTILIIYFIISVLSLLMSITSIFDIKRNFEKLHPAAKRKESCLGTSKFSAVLRLLIPCFIPIIHFFLVLSFLFLYDKVIEKGVQTIEPDFEDIE